MVWKRRTALLVKALVAIGLTISASCGGTGGTQPSPPATTVATTVATTTSAPTTVTSTVPPITTTSQPTTSLTTTSAPTTTTTAPTTIPTTVATTTSVPVLRADAGGPYRAEACTPSFNNCVAATITMSAIKSTSTFRITHYRWDCGQPSNPACSKDEITPMFFYVKAGDVGASITYTVTLTVEDERGNTNSTSTTVMVNQHY